MKKTTTPERTIPLLNPVTLDLLLQVARGHLCLPQTRLGIARLLTAGRKGQLAPDVGAHPTWTGWNGYYFASDDEFSDENRKRLVREDVLREHGSRIGAALVAAEEAQPKPLPPHSMLAGRVEREREERRERLRFELEAALEPEIAERLACGPADWRHVEKGTWRDLASGAEVSVGAEAFEVQIMLGKLDPGAVSMGGCTTVVVTDVENVTEADQARFQQRGALLVKLGPEYHKALETRLDALRSPLVTLPTI